jgi:F-type H+-transporting ATPase subunit b
MEFNLTTFILETINFLVLIWILKRLFYAPVKRVIEDRKRTIQKTLEDAEGTRRQAQELQAKYENRLRDWEKEKAGEKEGFQKELAGEKEKQMTAMRASVAQEREKLKVQEEKRLQELEAKTEREALGQSAQFASRLLSDIASPETEAKLVDLALQQLADVQRAPRLLAGFTPNGAKVVVRSAYPLPEGKKRELAGVLLKTLGTEPPFEFIVEKELLAGLRIDMGPVVLRANLKDELQFFSEAGLP